MSGFLSPPVAMAPFDLKGVTPKEIRLEDAFRGVMPFIHIAAAVRMPMAYAFPVLTTVLPDHI